MFFGPRDNVRNLKYPYMALNIDPGAEKERRSATEILKTSKAWKGPGETLLYSLTITVIVVTGSNHHGTNIKASLFHATIF